MTVVTTAWKEGRKVTVVTTAWKEGGRCYHSVEGRWPLLPQRGMKVTVVTTAWNEGR